MKLSEFTSNYWIPRTVEHVLGVRFCDKLLNRSGLASNRIRALQWVDYKRAESFKKLWKLYEAK